MPVIGKEDIGNTNKRGSPAEEERELRSHMPLDLGHNLRMRFCEEKDVDQAVSLFDSVWKRAPFHLWFEDLMSGRHPNVSFRDFTVVEDQTTGRLASLMGLVSQTWIYGGIPFGCGQPEAIATHPDYRQNGLVRRQMEMIHKLSEARGELVQVIWGNPWYYRQFGYEYAIEGLWDTRRVIHAHNIPDVDDPRARTCKIRPIDRKDYEFIRQLHGYSEKRSIIRTEKSNEEWLFHFEGWTEGGHGCREWRIIELPDGSPIGFLSFHNEAKSGGFGVHQIELAPDRSYLQVMPGILRQLWDQATQLNQGEPPSEIRLYLGQEHPAYQPILHSTQIRKGEMQCLYMRVQDIVSFLRHIAPALDKNLEGSPASGFTGTLQITMFRSGIEIAIDSGHITGIDAWKSDSLWHAPAFPDLTFLQLIFGRRRCAELADIYVDCNMDDQSALVLDSLFPPFKGTMWLGN